MIASVTPVQHSTNASRTRQQSSSCLPFRKSPSVFIQSTKPRLPFVLRSAGARFASCNDGDSATALAAAATVAGCCSNTTIRRELRGSGLSSAVAVASADATIFLGHSSSLYFSSGGFLLSSYISLRGTLHVGSLLRTSHRSLRSRPAFTEILPIDVRSSRFMNPFPWIQMFSGSKEKKTR